MDLYDQEAVARVWQRVHHGAAQEDTLLQTLLGQEQQLGRCYRQLAARAGRQAGAFRALETQVGGRIRTLSAMCALLCGQVGAQPQKALQSGSVQEEIRCAYTAELHCADCYARAAQRWPVHRRLLLRMAEQAQLHAARLLELTVQRQR